MSFINSNRFIFFAVTLHTGLLGSNCAKTSFLATISWSSHGHGQDVLSSLPCLVVLSLSQGRYGVGWENSRGNARKWVVKWSRYVRIILEWKRKGLTGWDKHWGWELMDPPFLSDSTRQIWKGEREMRGQYSEGKPWRWGLPAFKQVWN